MLRMRLAALRGLGRSTGPWWGRTGDGVGRQAWQRVFSMKSAPRASPWHQRSNGSSAALRAQGFLRSKQMRTTTCMPRASSTPKPRHFHTSKARRSQSSKNGNKGEPESLSLGSRFKKLSREYGWVAVGVYFGLSVLDFPLCFLLVRVVGTDKIGEIEELAVSTAQRVIPENLRTTLDGYWKALIGFFKKEETVENQVDGAEVVGWGVKEADARHKAEASLGTQLALAYAIHKTFIFVRIPLTAALVPKVTKVLRSWGWKIPRRNRTPRK